MLNLVGVQNRNRVPVGNAHDFATKLIGLDRGDEDKEQNWDIKKPWAARSDSRSPRYTTRWDELLEIG